MFGFLHQTPSNSNHRIVIGLILRKTEEKAQQWEVSSDFFNEFLKVPRRVLRREAAYEVGLVPTQW